MLFGTINKQMQLKYLDKYLCKICINFAHMLWYNISQNSDINYYSRTRSVCNENY